MKRDSTKSHREALTEERESSSGHPQSPRVSIGLPVYNGARYIHEAIDSIIAQTFTDFELIISDNASMDETETICRGYAAKDSRIRYVRQAENRGAVKNWQFLMGEAKGEYFKWIAHDDYLEAAFLGEVVHYLDGHCDAVLCTTDVKIIDGVRTIVRVARLDAVRDERDWDAGRRTVLSWSNIWREQVHLSIYGVYRLRNIRHCNLQGEGLWGLGDACEYPWLAQVAMQGRIVALPCVMSVCRIHENCASVLEYNKTFWLKRMVNYFFLLFRGMGVVSSSNLPLIPKIHILLFLFVIELPKLTLSSLCVCARRARRLVGKK